MTIYINTDGGSRGNPGPAGYGAVATNAAGDVLMEISEYIGTATNNVAEYSAVVDALETIASLDLDDPVVVRADSKLVVEQLSGRWKIKNPAMQELALRARRALPGHRVRFEWVPRAQNSAADKLANEAMDSQKSRRSGALLVPASGLPAVSAHEEAALDAPALRRPVAEQWDSDTLF